MHEINHGLGNLELVSEADGTKFAGLDDAYMVNMLDLTTNQNWNEMTDAERLASQVNSFGQPGLGWTQRHDGSASRARPAS